VDKNNNQYKTSDFGLAASLCASDVGLVGINKDNPRRAIFIFNDSDLTSDVIDSYRSGTLMVNAIRYFETTKRLKSQLYGD